MFEFKLPDIGEGLHEAELLEWDVKIGDTVAEGESIAQISTDKVNVELPSPRAGVIKELPWQPGDVIPVGQVLARIDDGSEIEAEPVVEESPDKAPQASTKAARSSVKAPPVVRRYAAENDVDLSQIEATGPNGMISKADIDSFLSGGNDDRQAEHSGTTQWKLSGPRLTAAKRLETSWRTLTTTAITFEVAADAIVAAVASAEEMTSLGVIASRLCEALKQHTQFNAVVEEEARALRIHDAVHLGIAVDSSDGLLVPVIRNADQNSEHELACAIAETAENARTGKLELANFQNSTFTLSSTGSIEEATITSTTPVVNFPNVATLWISRIRDRPRVNRGVLEAGPMMSCTLAFDHRFLHGADATRFINTLDKLLRR